MRRISTATKSVDKFGVGKPGFTNGNPSTGVPATDLEDQWFDHVQEELCALVEAAGGVVDGSTRTQVLTALRSAGVFQTPAQFDSTTKPATTAFVQRAIGNASAAPILSSARAILASEAGDSFLLQAAGTYTLPALSVVPDGARILFASTVSGVIISRAGTDNLLLGANSGLTVTLNAGDSAFFIAINGYWRLEGGSIALKYAAAFGSVGAANGYTKSPAGIIFQWGATSSISPGGTQNVTTPIAMPTAIRQVLFSVVASAATSTSYSAGAAIVDTQNFTAFNFSAGAGSYRWFAIGD